MLARLFVGNLSDNTTEGDIVDLFKQAGHVVSCNLIMDTVTNHSRGFAFLEMSTQRAARQAIVNFNGREVAGRILVVNQVRPHSQLPGRRGDLRRNWHRTSEVGHP